MKRLEKSLFYFDILLILIEGYFEFTISLFIWANKPYTSDSIDYFYCSILIAGIFIILPLLLVRLQFMGPHVFEMAYFKNQWEALYLNLDTRYKSNIYFYLVFICRRLVYILASFQCRVSFQILSLCFLNLFISMYTGYFRPFAGKKQNMMEQMNELFIQLASINALLFSGFVTDERAKYIFGWTFVIIVLLHITLNLVIMFYSSARFVKLVCLKYYNKWFQLKVEK